MKTEMMKSSTYLSALLLSLAGAGAEAAYYDFTTANTTATINDGVLMNPDNDTILGTGYFDPFIRTQVEFGHKGSCGTDCEQGYNTDGIEEFDTKESGGHNWNHSILYSDMQEVDLLGSAVSGGGYFEFLLDINEPAADPKNYLSLDELQFFVTSDPALTGYDDVNNLFSLTDNATLAWELDKYASGVTRTDIDGGIPSDPTCDTAIDPSCTPANPDPVTGAENSSLQLDYNLHEGSGKGIDLIALIPKLNFDRAIASTAGLNKNNAHIVLFNRFGDVQNAAAQSGFEEWAYRSKSGNGGGGFPSQVPEPGVLALIGLGLLGLLGSARQRRRG